MSAPASSIFIRLAAQLLGLCFAGAALAEPLDYDSAVKLAICYGNANQQYLIELAQCTDPYQLAYCQNMAQLHYATAMAACGGGKAASVSAGSSGFKAMPLRPLRTPGQNNTTATGQRISAPHFPLVMSAGNHQRR